MGIVAITILGLPVGLPLLPPGVLRTVPLQAVNYDLGETIGSTQHGCGAAGSGSAAAASMTPR